MEKDKNWNEKVGGKRSEIKREGEYDVEGLGRGIRGGRRRGIQTGRRRERGMKWNEEGYMRMVI